jgi:hypothetical protein
MVSVSSKPPSSRPDDRELTVEARDLIRKLNREALACFERRADFWKAKVDVLK